MEKSHSWPNKEGDKQETSASEEGKRHDFEACPPAFPTSNSPVSLLFIWRLKLRPRKRTEMYSSLRHGFCLTELFTHLARFEIRSRGNLNKCEFVATNGCFSELHGREILHTGVSHSVRLPFWSASWGLWHTRMRRVTHENKACHTHEWGMSLKCMINITGGGAFLRALSTMVFNQ